MKKLINKMFSKEKLNVNKEEIFNGNLKENIVTRYYEKIYDKIKLVLLCSFYSLSAVFLTLLFMYCSVTYGFSDVEATYDTLTTFLIYGLMSGVTLRYIGYKLYDWVTDVIYRKIHSRKNVKKGFRKLDRKLSEMATKEILPDDDVTTIALKLDAIRLTERTYKLIENEPFNFAYSNYLKENKTTHHVANQSFIDNFKDCTSNSFDNFASFLYENQHILEKIENVNELYKENIIAYSTTNMEDFIDVEIYTNIYKTFLDAFFKFKEENFKLNSKIEKTNTLNKLNAEEITRQTVKEKIKSTMLI